MLDIVDWEQTRKGLTGHHLPGVGRLLALGREVGCETKNVDLAPLDRADANEVEPPKVQAHAHLHRFDASASKEVVERVLDRIERESPRRDAEASNRPIIDPPFAVEASEDTITPET